MNAGITTIEGFVQAARCCREAGFDGVEVWTAYHGFVDQFWTPCSNRPDDRWGGSLQNRTLVSRETLSRIRTPENAEKAPKTWGTTPDG